MSYMSITKTNRRTAYVVRWREDGHHRSRSFATLREARAFDAAVGQVKRERSMTDLEREARRQMEGNR